MRIVYVSVDVMSISRGNEHNMDGDGIDQVDVVNTCPQT